MNTNPLKPRFNHPMIWMVGLAILMSMLHIFSNRRAEWFVFWSELMNFIYEISVSTIAAGIFYYIQVHLPEEEKKRILKGNFKRYWKRTKENIICSLLMAYKGSYDIQLSESLCDFKKFREYFNWPHEKEINQTRWHWVLNGLNEKLIEEIATEFELLIREIDYLLIKLEVKSDKMHQLLKQLQKALYYNRSVDFRNDDLKSFSRFLWDILGQQNIIAWKRDYDLVDSAIDEL